MMCFDIYPKDFEVWTHLHSSPVPNISSQLYHMQDMHLNDILPPTKNLQDQWSQIAKFSVS